MSFSKTWSMRSSAARVLFIVSIVYAISSINVLLLASGMVQTVPGAKYNTEVMLAYSLISFGYGLVLSIYHLYTFIARRKRNADKMEESHFE